MPLDPNSDSRPTTGGDFVWSQGPTPATRPAAASLPEPIQPLPAAWRLAATPPSAVSGPFRRANQWLGSMIQRFTLPEDSGPADPIGKLVASTPPWFISLIVHFGFMILLGLAVFGAQRVASITDDTLIEMDMSPLQDNEIYAESLGEQLEDPSVKMTTEGLDPSKDTVAALATHDLPRVDQPLIGPPVLEPSAGGTLPVGTIATSMIGLEFSGREEGVKDAMLKAYGGTKLTEDAVHDGLSWLVRNQKPRGSWSLRGPYKDGTPRENEQAATAMALLAFQGAGYTAEGEKNEGFSRVVAKGWAWLLRSQHEDGRFFTNDGDENQQLYTQAMCTIALCELYGMSHNDKYREPAQRAIDYCVKIQAPEGGWRYQPGVDSDLSVTGWFSMALQSARMAGLEVPSPTYANITKFLDSVAHEDGARYAYHRGDGPTLPITAEGLLCRQYLGWPRDDARLLNGVEYILTNLPAWDKRNVYYWYYATQVCHHMEGQEWQKWNNVMRQLLPENQEKRGGERGSWNPNGDRWGTSGGRLYVTCLSLYVLEVYYRHLPIYRHEIAGK